MNKERYKEKNTKILLESGFSISALTAVHFNVFKLADILSRLLDLEM